MALNNLERFLTNPEGGGQLQTSYWYDVKHALADLATPEPQPDPNPSEGGEGDDIGDEIQRIIASYSRARQQSERS